MKRKRNATTKACIYCGRKISLSNYSKHIKSHENGNFKLVYSLDHEDLFCKFCGKECKNKNSLVQHEIRCKENPDRKNVINQNFNNKGRKAWNKGLTKETDERVAKQKQTYIKNYRDGLHKHPIQIFDDKRRKQLSDSAKKHGLGGFAWRRGIDYNGIKLDSSYELVVAKDLDKNNIRWERPNRIKYVFNGSDHYYTPDFYLIDYDVYLDPKNDFLIENINPGTGIKDVDKIKLVEEQNNIKVIILNKSQLTWEAIQALIV